jgi:hypothetical protein
MLISQNSSSIFKFVRRVMAKRADWLRVAKPSK